MTRTRGRTRMGRYVACVVALGLPLTLWWGVLGAREVGAEGRLLWALLAACMVVAELFPIRILRRSEQEEVTTSTVFGFALLLAAGPGPAVLGHALTSVAGDLAARKPLWKQAFNVAQVTLTVLGAAAALALAGGQGDLGDAAPGTAALPAVIAAAVTFFTLNTVLAGAAPALATGENLPRYLTRDLDFWALTSGVLLAFGPVVLAAAHASLVFVPLFLIPVAVVHGHARATVRLEHQAVHDALTGLPNRILFQQRVEAAVAHAADVGGEAAVLLFDLDRFKEVNDTLGHAVGDRLLREVGPRVSAALPDAGSLSRLGGDEFGLVLAGAGREGAIALARHVADALRQPFPVGDVVLDIGGTVGISVYPDHGGCADSLLQRADVALYLAKENGQPAEVYSEERDPYSPQRLALLGDLRRAIDEGALDVHFQPKVELGDGKIVGAEALVRWCHPSRGPIPPDQFIPIAEAAGLCAGLTYVVLDRALTECASWRRRNLALNVAVNISVRNLHDPGFPDDVATALARRGVPACALELEITENLVMADPMRALDVLTALAGLGVGLAVDDFGTGYSSLSYLKRLPVTTLKIDRAFVTHMAVDSGDATIVRSTSDLATNLGLEVVAEGIETAEVWEALRAAGCGVGQGYLISRPLPAGEFARWLDEHVPAWVPPHGAAGHAARAGTAGERSRGVQ